MNRRTSGTAATISGRLCATMCLALHWFDPFVVGGRPRTDAELAHDAAAVQSPAK